MFDQIRTGGPVTVTHPEIRRYFMLIPEAVQLVLQAAALAKDRETFVLNMGEQIKVLDVARNLIRLSGFVPDEEIPITFIGLRPGEKLIEELGGQGEALEPAGIDEVLPGAGNGRFNREQLAEQIGALTGAAALGRSDEVLEHLCRIVPSFNPDVATAPDERIDASGRPTAGAKVLPNTMGHHKPVRALLRSPSWTAGLPRTSLPRQQRTQSQVRRRRDRADRPDATSPKTAKPSTAAVIPERHLQVGARPRS